MDSSTQCSKILKVLRKNKVNGVANYRFPQMGILCYSKRIQELREDGHNILAERQKINGRSTGVWYYHLIEEQTKPSLLDKFKHAVAA